MCDPVTVGIVAGGGAGAAGQNAQGACEAGDGGAGLDVSPDFGTGKRDYITAYNEKVAQLSSMGRTRDPSFRNILETDKRTLRRDLTYIGFSGYEKRLFNSAMAKESELAKQAVDPTAGIIDTTTNIYFKTKDLAEG